MWAKTNKAKTSVTVSTQKALNKALKNKKLKKLTIKTDKIIKFEISSRYFGGITLTVKAPNASFNNTGRFKSLNIEAASWTQNIKADSIKLNNSTSFVLTENVEVNELTISGKSNRATYSIKGIVNNVNINADCSEAVLDGKGSIAALNINNGGDFKVSDTAVGGIAGEFNGRLRRCVTASGVVDTESSSNNKGSIAGIAKKDAHISDCYYYGNVAGLGPENKEHHSVVHLDKKSNKSIITGLNFKIWTLKKGINDGIPVLKWYLKYMGK